jgi:hypothetical protein
VTCHDENAVAEDPNCELNSSNQIDHNNNNFDGSSCAETKENNLMSEIESKGTRSSEKQMKIIKKSITPNQIIETEMSQFAHNDACVQSKCNDLNNLNNKRVQRDKKIKTLIYEEQNRAILIENTKEHIVKIKQYDNLKKRLDFDEDQASIGEETSETTPTNGRKETFIQTIKTREYVIDADTTSNSPCVSTEASPYSEFFLFSIHSFIRTCNFLIQPTFHRLLFDKQRETTSFGRK